MSERKTVIVTGASRGLGAAAAGALCELGANVLLNARSEGDLQEVAAAIDPSGQQTLVVPGDVSQPPDCQRLIEEALAHFDRLDGLVNNAGVLQPIAKLVEADPAAWQHNLAVNLLGPFHLTQAAIPHLRRAEGRVINVSSGAAVRIIEGWSAYCVAKAGLNHFNRAVAAEEPAVVAISLRPGVVNTEMQAAIRQEGEGGMAGESHQRFMRLHKEGELLPPERPGRALAVLSLHAPHEWSGEFIEWDDERVQALVGEHF